MGKGCYGRVFLVREKRTEFNLMFALKSISKQYITRMNALENFRREVKYNLMLKHPNVVQMFGFLEDNERVYLLMEFAPNGNLFQKIQDLGSLSERMAATVY